MVGQSWHGIVSAEQVLRLFTHLLQWGLSEHLWVNLQTLLNRCDVADKLPPVSQRSPSRPSLERFGCTAVSPALRWGTDHLQFDTEEWCLDHKPISSWSWHTRNGLVECWPWTLTLLHVYRPTAQSEPTDLNLLYEHKPDTSAEDQYWAQKIWGYRTWRQNENRDNCLIHKQGTNWKNKSLVLSDERK